MKIYLAADHAGFELKNALLAFVRELGHEAIDCGAPSFDVSDDYPPIIAEAARQLSEDAMKGADSRAIVIGGSGQGEAIVANRFKRVRCALYAGETARQIDASGKSLDMITSMREHNNSNAISLAARFISTEEAKVAVERWLNQSFSGDERHVRRIKQIDEVN